MIVLSQPTVDRDLPREPFGVVAFCLAILLMMLPLGGDVLFSLQQAGRGTAVRVFATVCFLVVFVPFVLSLRRLRQKPRRYRGEWRLVFTGVVLGTNILSLIHLWFFYPM